MCVLWPYIIHVHISIMFYHFFRDFSREKQRLAEHPILRDCAAHSGTTRGLCHTSWIIHEPSAPHIKHTSCWIITAPVNNPFCSLQKTWIRGIVRGEQSSALSPRRLAGPELFALPSRGQRWLHSPLPQTASPQGFPWHSHRDGNGGSWKQSSCFTPGLLPEAVATKGSHEGFSGSTWRVLSQSDGAPQRLIRDLQ